MLNHPHDCPVCDEGGECHLQDMTVMTGHDYRALPLHEAHVPQPVPGAVREPRDEPLHPVLPLRALLPRYAGGDDLECVLRCTTRLLRPRATTACWKTNSAATWSRSVPTGVFTDKTLKHHYTRKWDLQIGAVHLRPLRPGLQHDPRRALRRAAPHRATATTARSTDISCATAAASAMSSSTAERRVRSCEPAAAKSAASDEQRGAIALPDSWHAGRTIGIGSPRASLEANFALRELVGRRTFYRRHRERVRAPAS